ncbi:MAG: hypothetical protein LBC61_07820 [Candidatus Peribacteria bacterium]|nr:hypothetical protein [Candidatus Peribacteria bacterium]
MVLINENSASASEIVA